MDDQEARRARRREIDEMVREALRAEAAGAPLPTLVVPPVAEGDLADEPVAAPPPRRRRALLVLSGLLVLAAVATAVLRLEAVPVAVQVLVGRETREPAVPTVYDDGAYAFDHTQPDAPDQPIGYDPCQQVPVRMNFVDAPPHALGMLQESIRRINKLTGLELRYVGASDDVVTDRHGGPVLVTWDRSSRPVAPDGRGWSDPTRGPGRIYYYSGSMMLFAGGPTPAPRPELQALVDRTMAQMVGLEEVAAPGELLSDDHVGRTTFGHGDLTGLAFLGRVPCA